MKKIGIVLDQQFPTEGRTEREILSYINAGFEVSLICLNFTNQKNYELYKGFHIYRLNYNKWLYKKLSAAYLMIPFHKWFWQYHLNKFIIFNKVEILHLHDLPLSNVCYNMKIKHGLFLIFDQHEYYSNWIVHTAHYNTLIGKIVKKLSNWKKYESNILPKADLILTIEEPLRQCYIQDVKINSHNILAIPNTALEQIFNLNNVNPEIVNKYKNDFVILYAGVIDILRGISVVLNSLSVLKETIPNIKFVLIGRTAKGCDPIKEAKNLGVEKYVEFVGWVDESLIPSYIAASKICNHTPYTDSDEVNNTIATKIYQYCAMEKPIITSQAKMMKEFVESNKIGFAIDTNNINSYVDAVLLLTNKNIYTEIVDNCKKIKKKLYWHNTISPLIDKISTF